jgi:hypothetical protein
MNAADIISAVQQAGAGLRVEGGSLRPAVESTQFLPPRQS